MGKLPVVSGAEVLAALRKVGYEFSHQKGSHMILRNVNAPFRRAVVPNHKEIAPGTLRAIIRGCGLTVDQFIELC